MAISVVGMRIRIQRKKKGAPTQSGGDFLLVQRRNSDVQEFIDSIFHVEMAFYLPGKVLARAVAVRACAW